MNIKKLLLPILVGALVLIGLVYAGVTKKHTPVVPVNETTNEQTETNQSTQLCFYKENKTANGLYDVAWMKMNIAGDQLTGEFKNLPAEKDSKIGTFKGTIGAVESASAIRTADVWWDSMAEGMQVTEQLKIIFNENVAQAGFSEMVDRGDGVYVYKDSNNIGYWQIMDAVSCADLDDRILVEKYIRANIATLVLEKAVLGGAWYATTIHIDPALKTGMMKYEDGHIQGSATFAYARNGEQVTLTSVQSIK